MWVEGHERIERMRHRDHRSLSPPFLLLLSAAKPGASQRAGIAIGDLGGGTGVESGTGNMAEKRLLSQAEMRAKAAESYALEMAIQVCSSVHSVLFCCR